MRTILKWLLGGAAATAVVVAIVAIVALVNVFTCFRVWCGGPSSNPVADASARAAQSALIASYGGRAPANCGGAPDAFHDRMAGTIWDEPGEVFMGRAPAWVNLGVFNNFVVEGGRAVLHLEHTGYKKTADGFPVGMEWVVNADVEDPIRVQVLDSAGGLLKASPPSYMHDPGLLVPSESRAISVGNTPPYRIFWPDAYMPSSPACYTVMASWRGGSWEMPVAVGL